MASFAGIEDGLVTQTMEVNDSEATNEATGADFLAALFGGEWVLMGGDRAHASIGWAWDGTIFTPPPMPDLEAV